MSCVTGLCVRWPSRNTRRSCVQDDGYVSPHNNVELMHVVEVSTSHPVAAGDDDAAFDPRSCIDTPVGSGQHRIQGIATSSPSQSMPPTTLRRQRPTRVRRRSCSFRTGPAAQTRRAGSTARAGQTKVRALQLLQHGRGIGLVVQLAGDLWRYRAALLRVGCSRRLLSWSSHCRRTSLLRLERRGHAPDGEREPSLLYRRLPRAAGWTSVTLSWSAACARRPAATCRKKYLCCRAPTPTPHDRVSGPMPKDERCNARPGCPPPAGCASHESSDCEARPTVRAGFSWLPGLAGLSAFCRPFAPPNLLGLAGNRAGRVDHD